MKLKHKDYVSGQQLKSNSGPFWVWPIITGRLLGFSDMKVLLLELTYEGAPMKVCWTPEAEQTFLQTQEALCNSLVI